MGVGAAGGDGGRAVGCTGGANGRPAPATMTIGPPAQLDEPAEVRVSGPRPRERTTVTAKVTDARGEPDLATRHPDTPYGAQS